jgi:hypothetical protein
MFRSKVFEPTLTGIPYLIFIEGLKSAVTKAAYTFALLINNNKSMLTFSTYKLSEHRDAQGAIKHLMNYQKKFIQVHGRHI